MAAILAFIFAPIYAMFAFMQAIAFAPIYMMIAVTEAIAAAMNAFVVEMARIALVVMGAALLTAIVVPAAALGATVLWNSRQCPPRREASVSLDEDADPVREPAPPMGIPVVEGQSARTAEPRLRLYPDVPEIVRVGLPIEACE